MVQNSSSVSLRFSFFSGAGSSTSFEESDILGFSTAAGAGVTGVAEVAGGAVVVGVSTGAGVVAGADVSGFAASAGVAAGAGVAADVGIAAALSTLSALGVSFFSAAGAEDFSTGFAGAVATNSGSTASRKSSLSGASASLPLPHFFSPVQRCFL